MYQNATGPHAHRTSGPHQRPVHPAYAQPRATGPHQASAPHRVTGPQWSTGPHHAPPPRRTGAPTTPPPPRRRTSSKLTTAALALVVAVGAGVGAAAFDVLGGTDNQFETVAYAGENPFTSPVGTDKPGMASIGGGKQRGNADEMYAQEPAKPACDGEALVTRLLADPHKAAAWAQVQRITPAQLQTYVDGLTPVLLRANTAVVDHGYEDGTYRSTPAVLAAGTAVFVNSYGQPTVKCFSGNPLTPGASPDPTVTTVAAVDAPIIRNVFHDITTSGPVTIPGKPDKTGSGPAPTGGGTTGGGTTTTTLPALTGKWGATGIMTLSDGRLMKANGEILPAPKLPEGTIPLASGGYLTPEGKFLNDDGTERKSTQFMTAPPRFLGANGTVVDDKGVAVKLDPGVFVFRNADGSITQITNGTGGKALVEQFDKDGKIVTAVQRDGQFDPKVNGLRVPPTNEIRNVDNSPRPESQDLPGGGKVGSDGTNTPPPAPKNTLEAEDQGTKNTLEGNDQKKPGTEDVATVDPATGKPIDPATGKPVEEGTGKQEPVKEPVKEPIKEPITDGPVEKGPVVDGPVEKGPVVDAPIVEAPVKPAPVGTGDDSGTTSTGGSTGTSSGGSASGESTGPTGGEG